MVWQKIRRSELLKNTSILVSGTALAQLIPILLQPILRRYYSPEVFGAYSVYLSLVGILYVLSSLRYEMAIALPKKDKIAENILVLSQIFNLIFNLILLFLILKFNKQILAFLNIPYNYRIFIYFVPLGTFLYNFYQSNHYWLIRKKAFIAVSKNKFARRLTEGPIQIFSKNIFPQTALVLGDISGHLINSLSGISQSIKKGFNVKDISKNKLKYALIRYAQFPKYNLISSFMGAFCFLIPTLVINKYYSSEYAGYFDLSKMVLSIPLALIAGSIANVLLQRFAEKKQNKISIQRDFISVLAIVLVIALVEIIVISLFGTELFNLIFGRQWSESGAMSKVLVWSYALNFIVFSFRSVFISLERIKLLSAWQMLYFIAIIILILLKGLNFDSFIKIYVYIEVTCFLLNFILLVYIVRKYEKMIMN